MRWITYITIFALICMERLEARPHCFTSDVEVIPIQCQSIRNCDRQKGCIRLQRLLLLTSIRPKVQQNKNKWVESIGKPLIETLMTLKPN